MQIIDCAPDTWPNTTLKVACADAHRREQTMSPVIIVLIILLVAIVLLVTEWIPMEVTALLTLGAVALTALVTPTEAISGFSSPAVVTVWAMFILSAGLSRTGVAGMLGRQVARLAGNSETRCIVVIMLSAGVLSAVMNNVAIAALMLPIVMDISRQSGHPPSRLLMPLAYGSLLGGLTTLIGTPPNILVSDALRDNGFQPFSLLDFTPIGLPIMLAGTLFMALVGRHLLPKRDVAQEASARGALDLREQYHLKERVFLLRLPAHSPLAGISISQAALGAALGLAVLGVSRNGRNELAPSPGEALQARDMLLVSGRLERLEQLRGWAGLELVEESALDHLSGKDWDLVELKLAESSELAGKTLREVRLYERYGVHVLSVRREGEAAEPALRDAPLAAGDWLLALGTLEKLAALKDVPDFSAREPVAADSLREVHRLQDLLLLAAVTPGSAVANHSLKESAFANAPGIRLLKVVRADGTQVDADPDTVLTAGDRLLLHGEAQEFRHLQGLAALEVVREVEPDMAELETERVGLMEAVLSPRTTLAGRTVRELELRDKFGLSLLAIWRGGRAYRSDLREMTVEPGDALLLYGPRERLRQLGVDPDYLVLTAAAQEIPRTDKSRHATLIFAVVLLPVLLGAVPIYIAAVIGAALMVLSGCLKMEEAYRAIEWKAVVLIAGLLPLGIALERSGAAGLLAENVVAAVGPHGPLAVMAGLMLITIVATSIVPTAALVVLMTPIVLSTAVDANLSPHALMMAMAMAASASFTSPVSHPANILVMGPGGYRFVDYVKVGGPLTLVVFAVTLLLLPWLWPLQAG